MKKILAAIFGLTLALSASAIPLEVGDIDYVGSIDNGIPSNPSDEVSYINYLITLSAGQGNTQLPAVTGETYNRVLSILAGPFSQAKLDGADKDETAPVGTISVTGYDYVLGKYGGGQAGYSLVWYVNSDVVGDVTLPSSYSGNGLSHISLYKDYNDTPPPQVPDGGMTLILLGMGTMILSGFRRFVRK